MPRLLLFDYGGVLLRLNDPVATFAIGESLQDFNERWLMSPAVRLHETGRLDVEDFARRMVTDMRLPYDWREFIARFDSWPDRVTETTSALVAALPGHIECAILSNTNARHWQAQDIERDFGGRISRCFLSFESGHVKPDREAFDDVLERVNAEPGDILFIDDNPRNLQSAAALGMQTRHCPNVDALAGVLRASGLLDG